MNERRRRGGYGNGPAAVAGFIFYYCFLAHIKLMKCDGGLPLPPPSPPPPPPSPSPSPPPPPPLPPPPPSPSPPPPPPPSPPPPPYPPPYPPPPPPPPPPYSPPPPPFVPPPPPFLPSPSPLSFLNGTTKPSRKGTPPKSKTSLYNKAEILGITFIAIAGFLQVLLITFLLAKRRLMLKRVDADF